MLLDDLQSRESAEVKVVFCSSIDFPSSKTEGGNDHTLLEQWNIKPMYVELDKVLTYQLTAFDRSVNTWSTDDTQKILWNEKALDNIYKKLPASNLFTPSTSYGISTISTSPVVSLSSLSTVVFHPDWEQGYEIHVSFATVLDEVCFLFFFFFSVSNWIADSR